MLSARLFQRSGACARYYHPTRSFNNSARRPIAPPKNVNPSAGNLNNESVSKATTNEVEKAFEKQSSSGGGLLFLTLALVVPAAGIVVGYAKVPLVRDFFERRNIKMPPIVHDIYRRVGWEAEEKRPPILSKVSVKEKIENLMTPSSSSSKQEGVSVQTSKRTPKQDIIEDKPPTKEPQVKKDLHKVPPPDVMKTPILPPSDKINESEATTEQTLKVSSSINEKEITSVHTDTLKAELAPSRPHVENENDKKVGDLKIETQETVQVVEKDEKTKQIELVELALEVLRKKQEEDLKTIPITEIQTNLKHLKEIREQREEFESILRQELEGQEVRLRESIAKEYQEKLRELLTQQGKAYEKAVQAQMQAQEAALSEKFSEELEEKMLDVTRQAADEAEERQSILSDLRVQVQGVKSAWESIGNIERASVATHRLTATALALGECLNSSNPVGNELPALLELVKNDEFAYSAVSAIPKSAEKYGIPTLSELRARFPRVRKECLRAAMVPGGESGGLAGQALGAALAAMTLQRHGLVSGNSADDILARAEYLVERGDLKEAVGELHSLQGLAAITARDWIADAEKRLATEIAMKALKAHIALVNLALVEQPSY